MIEKYTNEQLRQLYQEMVETGKLKELKRMSLTKAKLLEEVLETAGLDGAYMAQSISNPIYHIANELLEVKKTNKRNSRKGIEYMTASNTVSNEMREEYKQILLALVNAILPYYNKCEAFRKSQWL